jgi:hypothetical protein
MDERKEDMTYAYVTNECCVSTVAVRPGTEVGDKAVSRHGDYSAWPWGKRDTLRIMAEQGGYNYRCARAVALLLGWLGKEARNG